MKYVKVIDGGKSNAGGFSYRMGEVMTSDVWDPTKEDPKEFGGFNFTTEDAALRWLIRGDTICDVIIPDGVEVVEVENANTPHGVFRSPKILLQNPRVVDENIVMEYYEKSKLLEKTYFQCLTFLSLRGFSNVCSRILDEHVRLENQEEAYEVFSHFFEVPLESQNEEYKRVLKVLKGKIKMS